MIKKKHKAVDHRGNPIKDIQKDTLGQTITKFFQRNEASGGYLLKKRMGSWIYSILRIVLVIGLAFLILQPLLNKISLSFMAEKDLYDITVITVPRNFSVENYKIASTILNLDVTMWNTIWVSFLISVAQLLSCTLVAYGFARFKFPFQKFWFFCVIIVIVVPPQIFVSSLYLQFRFFDIFGIFSAIFGSPLNLNNSMIPYIMLCLGGMGLKQGLYIFILRQIFKGLPKELEEAAYIDGCGTFKTFARIMLPNATNALILCFLLAFVFTWTDGFYARIFLGSVDILPKYMNSITDYLTEYVSMGQAFKTKASPALNEAISATSMLIGIAPVAIVYFVLQRGFVKSMSQSGIKM